MHFQLFRRFLISMLLKILMKFLRQSRQEVGFLKNRSEENRKLFCKQVNQRVSVLQKSKKDYFANLNEKSITDNKRF